MNSQYDMRPRIQSGDLLAWGSDNNSVKTHVTTTGIRLLTVSEYSHVGIAVREPEGAMVVEATIPLIHQRKLTERTGFYHIPMGLSWNADLDRYLKHYIGKHYGLLDCFRGYLGHVDPSDDRWQCAELCNDFYRYAKIDLGAAYTPSTLVNEAVSNRQSSILYIK